MADAEVQPGAPQARPAALPRRLVSIRTSLARNLTLMILATSGAILVVSYAWSSRVVSALSAELIAQRIDQTEQALERFFAPAQNGLLLSRDWGVAGILEGVDYAALERGRASGAAADARSIDALNRRFLPVLTRYTQISSMMLSNTEGAQYLLLRRGDHWENRISHAQRWNRQTLWLRPDRTGTTGAAEWREIDYDPRTRPWYAGALESSDASAIHWTKPYKFFSTGEPGITGSIAWRDPRSPELESILAFDVLLSDISHFTSSLRVSEHGKVLVLTEDRAVIGLPRDSRFDTPEKRRENVLASIDELGLPELADAIQAWDTQKLTPGRVFDFESGGETWWGGARIFPLGERRFRIAVLAPERDFLAGIIEQRNIVIGITVTALAAAFGIAMGIARRYGRPLSELAEQAERIQHLDVARRTPVVTRLREIDQLADSQERMRTALDSFSRYVPIDVVRELMRRGEAAHIGGSRRHITVLFTDIQGFTTIAEALAPEDLSRQMTEYFEAMLGTVQGDGFGEVTQLTGDGFVGFWGAPIENQDHAAHAAHAVLRCREKLALLNRHWEARGMSPLPTRFGLATGPVVVGNVGSPARLVYTAVGDTINLASRLEGINRFYGTWVMVSEDVRRCAGDAFAWRRVDRVRAKGKHAPIDLFELLGRAGEVGASALDFARSYEEALALYQARRFGDVVAALEALRSAFRHDLSVERLLALARTGLAEPPPEGWDGTTVYLEK